jgi:hypothetical protein
MAAVFRLPASTTFTPEQALHDALTMGLADVIVIGYDQEGVLAIRSSRMTCAEAAFLTEKAKQWAMSGGQA